MTSENDARRAWVPAHLLEDLDRYVESGRTPSDFVRSVLENDLFGAMFSAHAANVHASKDVVRYVVNELPVECFGSKAKVEAWLALGGEVGCAKSKGLS